jgi:hypothetical protein
MIALMLIENRLLKNEEIGQMLDESRLPCPFGRSGGDGWERNLTQAGTGANWIFQIRKDLGMSVRRARKPAV